MPLSASKKLKLEDNKAVAPLTAAHYAAPGPSQDENTFDGFTSGIAESFLSFTLREEKVQQPRPVGNTIMLVSDTVFTVELFENFDDPSKTKGLRTRFTFREDQVQL